jgi:hypothetical protein
MLRSNDHHVEIRQVGEWKVNLTSYKIGDKYYCHIDNIDPGATIARSNAGTREEAVQLAMMKVTERLGKKPG